MAGKPGKGGRPATPSAVRIAAGTNRKHRHGKPEEAYDPFELPIKPHFHSVVASELWDEAVIPLIEAGVAKAVDSSLLVSMCELWGLYRHAFEIASQDPIDKDARIAVATYWGKFETAASRCGIGPTDRARLKIESGPAKQVKRGNA